MSDLKDFLEFRGLELGSGQRGVDLMKQFTSAQDLGEEYGYDVRIPSLGGLTVNEFASQNRNKLYPQFTDHYFTGEYPIERVDQNNNKIVSQLSLLSGKSNN